MGAILGFVAGIAIVIFSSIPQMFFWGILLGWWGHQPAEIYAIVSPIEVGIATIWVAVWMVKEGRDD